MRWLIEHKIFGFGVALATLTIVGLSSYWSTTKLIDTMYWVVGTNKVMIELEDVLLQMEKTQNGELDYIVTGKEPYLEACYAAIKIMDQEIKDLQQLTKDNPDQQPRLNIIKHTIAEQLVFLNGVIDMRRNKGSEVTLLAVLHDKEKSGMANVEKLINKMENEENELLKQRSEETEANIRTTIIIMLIGGSVSFILLILIFYLLKREITERKQAEEKIREQAELLDKAQDAIVVRDRERRIIYWNKSAERLYGWKAVEAMSSNTNNLLYEKAGTPKLIEAQENMTEKGGWIGELHQVTKDGREVIVESRWTLVRGSDGKPKSILIVNTDITEKKKLEAQFLRAQRIESIGTLAGGIAHDLNNVLSPITLSLELLRKKITDEKSQSWFKILDKSTQRGANLVKQVLSFARGLEGERTIMQIRYLISEIQEFVKETFPRSIEIHTYVPKDLWLISGDPTQLHQVLMNLCVNARDAMPEGGRLNIFAENLFVDEFHARTNIDARLGPYTVITISDAGVGISSEIIDRIFEPFFTTKEPERGLGLGLSTVFGIIREHGGFINVNSEVGRGLHLVSICQQLKREKSVKQRRSKLNYLWGKGN